MNGFVVETIRQAKKKYLALQSIRDRSTVSATSLTKLLFLSCSYLDLLGILSNNIDSYPEIIFINYLLGILFDNIDNHPEVIFIDYYEYYFRITINVIR